MKLNQGYRASKNHIYTGVCQRLFIILLFGCITACDGSHSASSTGIVIHGKSFTAKMTDEQILTALGIDPAKANSTTIPTVDRTTKVYQSGQQTVTISRAGNTVMLGAQGPTVSGNWTLP